MGAFYFRGRKKLANIAKNETSPHARGCRKSPESRTWRTYRRCVWGPFIAKTTKSRQQIQSPHPRARPARPKEDNKRNSQPKTEGSQMIFSNFRVPFGLRLFFYRNWLLCEPPGGFSMGIGHSWSLFWLPKMRPRHILAPGQKSPKIAKNAA